MNKEKLIYQLFIGKVVEEIGFKRARELLKEAKDAFKEFDIYEEKKSDKNKNTV